MPSDWTPLWLSLRLAAIATLACLGPGLWLAAVLAGGEFRGRIWIDAAVTLLFIVPSAVLAYYALVTVGRESLLGRMYQIAAGRPLTFELEVAVIAAALHAVPLMAKASQAALDKVDHTLEKAARSLGASEWRVFWRISFPLAWRGILVAGAVTFARSAADFGITFMLAGEL